MIGVIPIDSIYMPVKKVNYSVEPTRVGDKTDFDKLTLEVWTDSTISAKDAVSLGAKILSDHLTVFTNLGISANSYAYVGIITSGYLSATFRAMRLMKVK